MFACSVDVGVAPASSAGSGTRRPLGSCGSPAATSRTEHRCDVSAAGIGRTQPEALCCNRAANFHRLVADRPVKPTLLSNTLAGSLESALRRPGHGPHVEGFDPDRVEAASNVSGGLLHRVLAPVDLPALQLRDRQFWGVRADWSPAQPGRAAAATPSTASAPTPGQTGCVQQFASRQRRRTNNTSVNVHHAPIPGPADRSGDVGECDTPAPGPITGNSVGLHTLRHGPRQPKPHPSPPRAPTTKAAV